MSSRENSAINASTQPGNNGSVEERIKFGGVVGGQQSRTCGAATRQTLCRTSRSKVVVVKRYVIIFVIVG